MGKKVISPIDIYILGCSKESRVLLETVRKTIHASAPEAEETVKYGIPTFTLHGNNIVHFGGYKNHIGFYPTPSGIEAFKKELSVYKGAKGSVRFPLDEPLPLSLITKIVKMRVKESLKTTKK